jgi:23S rRNA pseudouridine1911/1915/1917 synthase
MLDILFEDADCLVINKPAGLLTQAPLGIDSLEFRIKRFFKERDAPLGDPYLGVPHRLDRPASGVIVFAKHLKAAQRISKQFESRRVEKIYWALAAGTVTPAEGTWTDYLKKIEGEPRTLIAGPTDPAARVAILHYTVLQNWTDKTLLEIGLETGRTHQIRVQCASHCHPLIGDELYGSQVPFGPPSADARERLIALHARTLRFWHHSARGFVSLTAPLPEHWKEAGISIE